jgi:hypothetical protein
VLLLGCAAPEARKALASGVPSGEPPAREPARPSALAPEPLSLELIDDFNPPRPTPIEPADAPGARWDEALGGLSGLDYDRAKRRRKSETAYRVALARS